MVEEKKDFSNLKVFRELYSTYYNGFESFCDKYVESTIDDVLTADEEQGVSTERIYALYEGKILLVWESEGINKGMLE